MVKPPSLIIPEEETSSSLIALSESGSFHYGAFRIDSKGFTGLTLPERQLLPSTVPRIREEGEEEAATPHSSSAGHIAFTPVSSSTPQSASSTHSSLSSLSTASTATRSSAASTASSQLSLLSSRPHSVASTSSPVCSAFSSASPSTPSPLASFTLSDLQLDSATDARLGRGASGSVHRAIHLPSNTPLAVKQIPLDLSEAKSKQIVTELRTLHTSECRQVVGFHNAFYRERMMTLVLEYMDVGSLKDFMTRVRENERKGVAGAGRVSEQLVSLLCRQVLLALHYLHREKRLIHRDIKPSNILLNSRGDVKLADFGVSGEVESDMQGKMTFVGTLIYMSPERITGAQHGYDSDVWSLGLTMMECLLGRFPYQPSTPDNRKKQHLSSIQLHTSTGVALPSGRLGGAATFTGGDRTPLSATSIFTQRSYTLSPTANPMLSPHTPSPSSASSYLYNGTNTTAQTPPKLCLPRPAPTLASAFTAAGSSSALTSAQHQQPFGEVLPAAPQPQMKRESSFCFWGAHECIVKDPPPSLPSEQFSAECRDFFALCLQKESERRSSAADLLQHPFITRWQKSDEEDRRVLREWVNSEMAASVMARSSSRARHMQDAQTAAITNDEERKRKWPSPLDATSTQPLTILAQARTPNASTPSASLASSAANSQPVSGTSSVATSTQSSLAPTPSYLTPSHATSITPSTYHCGVHSPSLFSSPILLPPLPPLTKSTSSVSPDTYLHTSGSSPFHSNTPSSGTSSASNSSSGRFSPLRIEVPGRKRRRADEVRDSLHVRVGMLGEHVRERARELQSKRDKRRRADTPEAGSKDAGMETDNSIPSPETSPLSSASITSTSSSSSLASHPLPLRMFGRTVPSDLIVPAVPGSPFGQLSIFPPFSPGVVTGSSGSSAHGSMAPPRLLSPTFLPLRHPTQPHTAQEES